MNPTTRWMILGGAVVAVVIIALGIFFLTRPPAAITAEFEGVVASGDAHAFVLKDVQAKDSRVTLCSRDNLAVRVERAPVSVNAGDRVAVKGEYHEKTCQVTVKSAEHSVRVTILAPVAIELEGVVARAGQESFTLSEVTVLSGPQPCSLERLIVQIESRSLLPSSALQAGDLVTVKGEYHAEDCTVRLSAPTHYVELRPVSIELEGIVSAGTPTQFALKSVVVLAGPQPCRLDNLPVQVKSEQAQTEPVQLSERVRVKGEYHPESCRVELASRQHSVERLPTTIKLQGTVAQVGSDQVILQSVRVLEGPQPCTTENLAVRVRGAAALRGGEGVEVVGEYNPKSCQVSVEQPTHSFARMSTPLVPVPPVTPPSVPQPPGVPPIPTPTGGLPFFISGGVSSIGPVLAFRGSVGMAFNNSLKGMISVGYGSGSIQKPELTKPVTFTVMPVDFTVWYSLGGGLHVGGGAGVLIVQGPKPKFSNTVPTVHIAIGFAITDFLMLSGGIAYVP
uniref:DUF5666 domain-containing protein n=2 Tax=Candidatus Bipolaricaulota TaxID=67810 RepID=H5SFB9_9BACT|nr:hypothetical protein HGMM_F21A08C38 [uncultured Acetothermia bacterium]BAL58565.1 hypothetical protein HGMM_OP2C115 [Candidatus Acetothermum autotrophicum]